MTPDHLSKLLRQNAEFATAIEQGRPPPPPCPRCKGPGERTTGLRWNVLCTVCGDYYIER